MRRLPPGRRAKRLQRTDEEHTDLSTQTELAIGQRPSDLDGKESPHTTPLFREADEQCAPEDATERRCPARVHGDFATREERVCLCVDGTRERDVGTGQRGIEAGTLVWLLIEEVSTAVPIDHMDFQQRGGRGGSKQGEESSDGL